MQKTSLVECINPAPYADLGMQANTPYTVINAFTCDCGCNTPLIQIEEISAGTNAFTGSDLAFDAEDFREIVPPMDIQKLVEESITETV